MNRRYLQCIDRESIDLLTEDPSRAHDGGVLDVFAVPQDGLRRVFIGDRDIVQYGNEERTTCDYPTRMQLCVRVLSELSRPDDIFWCVGEEYVRRLSELRQYSDIDLRSIPSARNEENFIFKVEAREAGVRKVWPTLRNELSLHIFCNVAPSSNLYALLENLYDNLHCVPEESNRLIRELMTRCLMRDEIATLSRETSLMLFPDGSHFHYPSIHTSAVELCVIVEAFACIAREYGYTFNCQENVGRTYLDYFDRVSRPVWRDRENDNT